MIAVVSYGFVVIILGIGVISLVLSARIQRKMEMSPEVTSADDEGVLTRANDIVDNYERVLVEAHVETVIADQVMRSADRITQSIDILNNEESSEAEVASSMMSLAEQTAIIYAICLSAIVTTTQRGMWLASRQVRQYAERSISRLGHSVSLRTGTDDIDFE